MIVSQGYAGGKPPGPRPLTPSGMMSLNLGQGVRALAAPSFPDLEYRPTVATQSSIRVHCGFRLRSLDCAGLDCMEENTKHNMHDNVLVYKAGYRLLAGYIPACM